MRIITVPRSVYAPPPSTPTLSASASGTTQINLTAASVSSVGIASYTFEVATSSGGPWTVLATQASGSYSLSGLDSGTTRHFRVYAVDGNGQQSGYSAVVAATTASTTVWASQDPVYPVVWQGSPVWGTQTRFAMGTNAQVYLVDPTDNDINSVTGFVATRVRKCSLPYFAANAPSGSVGLCNKGGRSNYNGVIYMRGEKALICQTAGARVMGKNTRLRSAGGSQLVMHWENYAGDITASDGLDNRDSIEVGDDYENSPPQYQAWISDGGHCGVDEALELYGGSKYVIIHRCHFNRPLFDGKNTGDPHGAPGIIGDAPDYVYYSQNLIAHGYMRNPFLNRGRSVTMVNNLIYNAGGLPWWQYNEWMRWDRNLLSVYPSQYGGADAPQYFNVIGNLAICGPNTYVKSHFLNIGHSGQSLVPGSQLWLEGNRFDGFTFDDSDEWNCINDEVGAMPSVRASGRIGSIIPTGFNPYSIPNTLAGKKAFAELMAYTVGAMPRLRTAGIDAQAVWEPYNRLNGSGSQGGIIDLMSELSSVSSSALDSDGYPTCPTTAERDLFDSVEMNGFPLPTVEAGRDVIQSSGLTALGEFVAFHDRQVSYSV